MEINQVSEIIEVAKLTHNYNGNIRAFYHEDDRMIEFRTMYKGERYATQFRPTLNTVTGAFSLSVTEVNTYVGLLIAAAFASGGPVRIDDWQDIIER